MVRSVSLASPGSRQRQHWIVRSIEVALQVLILDQVGELVMPLGSSL